MSTKQLIWQKAVSLQMQGKKVMSCGWWDFFHSSWHRQNFTITFPFPCRLCDPHHPPHQLLKSWAGNCAQYSFPSQNNTSKKKNLTQSHTHQKPLILLEIPGVKQVWFDTSETSHHCHSTPPPQSNARLHKTWWGGPSSLPLSPG